NCNKEKESLKNTNKKLKQELENCNKEKEILQDKNKKLEDEINKLKENEPNENLINENKELRKELDKYAEVEEEADRDIQIIRELETQLSKITKNRDNWKKQSEEWKKQANEMEEQLKECEKYKKEVEDKINKIMITHLNISRIEIEKLTTIRKLETILNFIKQEVKECLRLLGIPFQTGDSLISMLKKLVKACEEIGITGPVQE
ncbi:6219_t:CDS:2, partial [Racocetra persica]